MIQEVDNHFNREELEGHIARFPDTRILVIGDVIMDEFIWGDVSRISPEAPVPVVDVRQETKMLGGAANVINNLCALGAKPVLCGVIGDDPTGHEVIRFLENLGLTPEGLVVESERPTSIKTRIVAHGQQVVRFDREIRSEISPECVARLLDAIRNNLGTLDAIIIADYGKGVISEQMMKGLVALTGDTNTMIAVDPKTENYAYYRGIDVLTPNHHEAGAFCHMEIVDEGTLVQAGNQILRDLQCGAVLITQGKDGMTLFEKGGEISHIPTVAREVYDVTGAGDTVIAALVLGMASGLDLRHAAIISNFAAGIVVGELGTSTVRAEELKKVVNGHLLGSRQ
ncbi:MAG: D-glycero-beta-D-manno-heptose-7-phosphate kinase [Deltaproteobacteria bacterium]|nr:D-glycero-beta-D-manno-heptose-7-phosphate kinase [Deltaproteobacteria bacterium]MBW2207463.1 D-glycero-beta-D-manno-heptose-7-phosphate kinase [Deltaproteobacteria bacterium]